jgi:thiol-disulfide isomerase/thioredoxin
MRFGISILLILIVGALTPGCASGPRVGSIAFAPELGDSPGDSLLVESFGAKVVVLYFWATWCQPCRSVSPLIQELHEEFLAGEMVSVVGIHYNRSENAATYMESHGYTYGLVPDGTSIADKFGVKKIPTLIIIGTDRTVIYRETGPSDQDIDNASRAITGHLRSL